MKKQYVLSEKEVHEAISRMRELRHAALLCRDAEDKEFNREFYLMAKGFEDALRILGLVS